MKRLPRLALSRFALVRIGAEIVVNFALPYVIFAYLQSTVGDVKALIASSGPPIVWSVVELVRKRRVDAISLMVIAGILLGLLAFVGGGSVKFLQLRENLVTGIIALVFIGSAVVRRPLIYEFARAGMARQSSEKVAELAALRSNALFRRSMFVMTLVWGFGMLALTLVACVLVYVLSIRAYLIVAPIVGNVGFAAIALWTFWYANMRRRKREALPSTDATT